MEMSHFAAQWNVTCLSVNSEHPESTKACKLVDDMTISIFKRIIVEEIWKVKHSWKRLVSGIPVRREQVSSKKSGREGQSLNTLE
jgi:hypothetical protein